MKQYKKLFAVLTLLCFAMTFLPVAAFAAFDAEQSSVFTVNENETVEINEAVDFAFDFDGTTDTVYVWFVKDSATNPTVTASVKAKDDGLSVSTTKIDGVYKLTGTNGIKSGAKFQVEFATTGKYTIAAAAQDPYIAGKSISECMRNIDYRIDASDSNRKTITVENNTATDKYKLQLIDNADLPFTQTSSSGNEVPLNKLLENGDYANIGAGMNVVTDVEVIKGKTETGYEYEIPFSGVNNHLATNGVASSDITFKLLDENDKAVKGAIVKLSTSNTNCIVNKEKVTTDTLGQFSFNITITEESPNTDGFTIYIECGSYEAKLIVTASSTSAYDLAFTKMPTTPISTDDASANNILDDIWVAVKDVNGNFVKPLSLQPGGKYAEPGFAGVEVSGFGANHSFTSEYLNKWGKTAEDYVSIISKPAGSKLENKDIWLTPVGQDAPYQNTLYTTKDLIAGEYTLKLTLENGKYKTITFTVAEMGTPVGITVTPKAAVTELGTKTTASIKLVDANGVKCDAIKKGTDVAVNGYGVLKTNIDEKNTNIEIWTKNNDKYAGSEIKIVASNDRYNLVGEGTIKITDGNAFIYCPTTEAKINTPTDLTYLLMDGQNMMNISSVSSSSEKTSTGEINTGAVKVVGGQTSFVVVAKPEGAKVNFDARAAGGAATSITGDSYAMGRIECDKPGVVTVKMTLGVQILQEDGTWSPRYYTGTQNIVFSDGSIGKTVVMSIGSSEIVIDGEKAAIDAAPIVQNSRTYVPFRALAEAFGAEVVYDEATQAVTATLGSNTVVMTIGSATYTVNGEEKTADVAPFISGGRTMVPVRFAAEAFGSKVIPTYDDNGATADVLFKL